MDSLQELLFNHISQQRKIDLNKNSNEYSDNRTIKNNIIKENVVQNVIQESNKEFKIQVNPQIKHINYSNNNTNFLEKNLDLKNSPVKCPVSSETTFIQNGSSNKKSNCQTSIKDKKDTQVAQIDIDDKCIFVYFCKGKKKGCKSSGDVWGSNPYTCDTDLCRAGIHANQVDENGGLYIVAYGGPYNNFVPSQKNGILSNVWESQDIHFVVTSISSYEFNVSKLHFDKCGLYIGVCIGKNNGCSQNGVVFGSNPYSHESNACCSALHSSVINENGGTFAIHMGGQVNRFIGSTSNGITSEKNGFDASSFSIKPYK